MGGSISNCICIQIKQMNKIINNLKTLLIALVIAIFISYYT